MKRLDPALEAAVRDAWRDYRAWDGRGVDDFPNHLVKAVERQSRQKERSDEARRS